MPRFFTQRKSKKMLERRDKRGGWVPQALLAAATIIPSIISLFKKGEGSKRKTHTHLGKRILLNKNKSKSNKKIKT